MSATTPPYTVDFEKLLAPITPARPAGESLRYEGTYDRIREARREDDSNLSRGIYTTDLKRADWAAEESLCVEALEARTKDLQIAAWLLEAWLHLYGFAGVREGMRLLAGLVENFWEDLYPEPEGEDFESRVAPVVWVDEKLSIKLKQVPITQPRTNDGSIFSLADWESACHLDNLSQRGTQTARETEANTRVTLSKFQSSVMLTPSGFYAELLEHLTGTLEACEAFERLLEEKFGQNAPGLYHFKEAILAAQRLASEILHARPDELSGYASETAGEPAEYALEDETAALSSPGELWSGSPIRSRAEAYQRLSEAADYLLRTEPHSPTPYLVRRAVEWGSMNLFDVLQQVIRNEGEMQELNRLLRLSNKEDG
jgi:type VI secretion system protein ImpA